MSAFHPLPTFTATAKLPIERAWLHRGDADAASFKPRRVSAGNARDLGTSMGLGLVQLRLRRRFADFRDLHAAGPASAARIRELRRYSADRYRHAGHGGGDGAVSRDGLSFVEAPLQGEP